MRRTTIQDPDANFSYEVLAIEDLVRAKKTQRDKDWPMIRRLVEAHYEENQDAPRLADEEYWKPLKAELEQLRLNRHRRK